MRDAGGAAGFKNAEAGGHGHDATVRIGDADAPARWQGADGKDAADGQQKADIDGLSQLSEDGRVAAAFLEPAQHRQGRIEGPGGDGETDQRDHGHEDGGGIERKRIALEPALAAQPEPDAETAMCPGGDERERLFVGVEIGCPDQPQEAWIIHVETGDHELQPRADDMGDEQEGQAEAKDDFQRLPKRHAQCLSPVEAVEGHGEMREKGAVEKNCARPAAPDPVKRPTQSFHRLDRHKPEDKIAEMSQNEDRQHEAGEQVQFFAQRCEVACQMRVSGPCAVAVCVRRFWFSSY